MAEAKLAVASKMADAKKREAEGIEAVSAAGGLAEARVAMAKADAHEKEGLVAAKIKLADADAKEKDGIVAAKIKLAGCRRRVQTRRRLRARPAMGDGGRSGWVAKSKPSSRRWQIGLADADAVAKQGVAHADALRLGPGGRRERQGEVRCR